MLTIYDILSLLLVSGCACLFLLRMRHEKPRYPAYIVIFLVCSVGAWLGNNGGGVAAVAILISAYFFLLHLASEPYAENPDI